MLGASTALGDHLAANPAEWRSLATPTAPGGVALDAVATIPELRLAYRRALSHADAVARLRESAGTQLDPGLVERFITGLGPDLDGRTPP